LHSPDVEYDLKMAKVLIAHSLVSQDPQQYVLLYEDELTYYRASSVARGYAQAGADAPRAEQGCGTRKWRRIAGSLDVCSGRLFYWQRDAFDSKTLLRYYQAVEAQVRQVYPQVEVIFMALDNWPPHFQSDLLDKLAKSQSKLRLLSLPTYAPWTNPIEKVWHKLYGEVLHLHEHVNDWKGLQGRVEDWLAQYADGSSSLLHYVGLLPD
jgi:hypothetical protein